MKKNKSIFNLEQQQNDVSGKIVIGLERISEAFRVLLWDYAKKVNLSPIQIQILIFIKNHRSELCGVSHLAKEFNLTKPTISDAVKSLEKKGFIERTTGEHDARVQILSVTKNGEKLLTSIEHFTDPLQDKVDNLPHEEQLSLLTSVSKLIYRLNQSGVITVQRTCYACKYYADRGTDKYCNLMKSELKSADIRLDCPEFEIK